MSAYYEPGGTLVGKLVRVKTVGGSDLLTDLRVDGENAGGIWVHLASVGGPPHFMSWLSIRFLQVMEESSLMCPSCGGGGLSTKPGRVTCDDCSGSGLVP